jgi:NAD(P)-dependent dehydrogenase (short-subunit alcohol dehydrogenase family)
MADTRTRPLEGRTVLVTGGSRGLGAATSRRLAAMGARVVLTYRTRADEGEAVAASAASTHRGHGRRSSISATRTACGRCSSGSGSGTASSTW